MAAPVYDFDLRGACAAVGHIRFERERVQTGDQPERQTDLERVDLTYNTNFSPHRLYFNSGVWDRNRAGRLRRESSVVGVSAGGPVTRHR